jgi:hypothetical protein
MRHHEPFGASRFCRTLAIAAPLAASACGVGQQLAAGPVIGYTFGRGASMGWEASGGPFTTTGNSASDHPPSMSSGFTRFSTGMSWRSAGVADTRERISYLAWEPWFLVGGTAGVASSSTEHAWKPMLGVWEGAPYVFGGQSDGGLLVPHCGPCWTISVAVGWRWAGAGEVYLAPKFGVLNDEAKPYPFTHVPD